MWYLIDKHFLGWIGQDVAQQIRHQRQGSSAYPEKVSAPSHDSNLAGPGSTKASRPAVWTTEGCGRTRSGVRGCGYGRLMTERTARPAASEAVAEIGIIGGSGFYSLLDTMTEVDVDTPWGKPSDPITVGEVAGRRVAFLPRHGRDHRYP